MKEKAKDYFELGEGKEILDISEIFLKEVLDNINDHSIHHTKTDFRMNRNGFEYRLDIEKEANRISFKVFRENYFRMKIIFFLNTMEFSYSLNDVWIDGITNFLPISIMKDGNEKYFEFLFKKITEISEAFIDKNIVLIDVQKVEEQLKGREKEKEIKEKEKNFSELKEKLQSKLNDG